MRDGHNGYLPSAGIPAAREAVAADYTARGVAISPDRVLITTGHVGRDRAGAQRARGRGRRGARAARRPIRSTRRCWRRSARSRGTTAPIRTRDWLPDLDHLRSLVTPRTRVLVVIDPNNPTGAVYPPADAPRADRRSPKQHDLTILADEVYGDLGFDGPVPLLGTLDPDAPIISFSSLSKAYLAPGWRAGWMVVGATPRLDDVLAAIKKLADGRLCSPGPDAVRRRRGADRRPLAPGELPRGAGRARAHHDGHAQRDSGHALRRAARGVLRAAVGVAAARADRRGLRAGAAARDRHPLRPRLRLRRAAGAGLLPHRLPGGARASCRRSTRTSPRSRASTSARG